ncbi:hypothetical protein Tco_0588432 [Tanacetum coccineum]
MFRLHFRDGLRESVSHFPILTDSIILILVLSSLVEVRLSRFQQNPNEVHWTTVKTILKFLRNTKDMVLVYGVKPEAELKVSCYADAAVCWKSAKQSTIAMSSTEAEYIDAAEASMEAIWMRKFIDGLGNIMPSNKRPMEMLCDNAPAIAIVKDPRIMKGARHYQRNITTFVK